MALPTRCQTPGAEFFTSIGKTFIEIAVELPFDLALDQLQAEELDTNLHNAVELVLAPYFRNRSV